MPKNNNNKEFNTNFLKQFLQNEENTAAKLAIISAALLTLGGVYLHFPMLLHLKEKKAKILMVLMRLRLQSLVVLFKLLVI